MVAVEVVATVVGAAPGALQERVDPLPERPRCDQIVRSRKTGYRVAFATAGEWVSRLEAAQDRNELEGKLRQLERYHLLVVDQVGYLPLERQAANLLLVGEAVQLAYASAQNKSPEIKAVDAGYDRATAPLPFRRRAVPNVLGPHLTSAFPPPGR
jgi:hypothetical protein